MADASVRTLLDEVIFFRPETSSTLGKEETLSSSVEVPKSFLVKSEMMTGKGAKTCKEMPHLSLRGERGSPKLPKKADKIFKVFLSNLNNVDISTIIRNIFSSNFLFYLRALEPDIF